MKIYQLEAVHPTTPGTIRSTSTSRAEAEREGIGLLRMIGDDLIERLENYGVDTAEEKRAAWAKLRDTDQPFIVFSTFVAGIQPTDGPEQRDNLEYLCVIHEIDVEDEAPADLPPTMHLIRAFLPGRQGIQTTLICATGAAAAARAKALVCEIGEHMVEHAPQGSVNGWDIAKMNDWDAALDWLRETWPSMGFDVAVDEVQVEGLAPSLSEYITSPGVAAGLSDSGPLATAASISSQPAMATAPLDFLLPDLKGEGGAFYVYDAVADGTISGIGPFWAESDEEADREALEQFTELWPSIGAECETWDDFASSCDATGVLTRTPIQALADAGKLNIPISAAEARLALQMAIPYTPLVLHEANSFRQAAESTIRHLIGSVQSLSHHIDQMKGMFPGDASIGEALEDGELTVAEAERLLAGIVLPADQAPPAKLDEAVQREAREERLRGALHCAIGHIESQARVLGEASRTLKTSLYSFESLGEDMPGMKDALADVPRPIGEHIGGVPMKTQLFAAGVELHALLGEAMERHIYDLDNGDEIPADCAFAKGMADWVKACAGTFIPAIPEIAVILEGGLVQNIVARNRSLVTVHIVDYDVEGADEEDLVAIPQDGGDTADAVTQCYSGKLDQSASPEFWLALS